MTSPGLLKGTQIRLDRSRPFFLRICSDDYLFSPTVILKAGTPVYIEKVYLKKAALLRYTDKSGKVWWSWMHV